ncbi:MAG: prolipoprotein diacylglyceryl transferase [Pirellulales bacterium]
MLQTLFVIPNEIAGVPLFGFGVVAALWAAWCVVYAVLQGRRSGFNSDLLTSLGVMAVVGLVIVYVVPRIMVHDEATGVTGIAIRGYGVMLLSGIVAGVGLTVWRARRVGVSPEMIFNLALWVFVAGMVGARAFYVIEYWKSFQRESLGETIIGVLNMTQGGLVVFGGFLGAMAAFAGFAFKHKLPMFALADLAAPGMLLGLALGRIGCYCNGCCFGDTCAAPWAVEFPAGSPPHIRQVEQGKVFGFLLASQPSGPGKSDAAPTVVSVETDGPAAKAGLVVGERILAVNGAPAVSLEETRALLFYAVRDDRLPLHLTTDRGTRTVAALPGLTQHSLPTHPAQLYAAVDAVLGMLLLLAFTPLSRRDGETFALLLTIHPISRFLLEEIRIDEPGMFGTQLSISQHVSILLLAAAVAVWIYVETRPRGFAWPRRSQPAAA